MPNEIKICECQVEDVDDCVEDLWLDLAKEMFEIEHFTISSKNNGDVWVKFVREGIAAGRNFLLVAKDKKRLVGFAYATIFRDHPFKVTEAVGVINDVYVLPEFRGKGIGKRLMVECLTRMKTEGVKAARLTVLTENKAAIKLYEKLGFKICRYGMVKAFGH